MSNEPVISDGYQILVTPALMEIGKIYPTSANGTKMYYQLVEPNTVHVWQEKRGVLKFLYRLFKVKISRRIIDV